MGGEAGRGKGDVADEFAAGAGHSSSVLSIKYRNLTANKISYALHSIERKFARDNRVVGLPEGYGLTDPTVDANPVARGVDIDGGGAGANCGGDFIRQ